MLLQIRPLRRFVLLFAPLVTSTAIAILPSEAATFSNSTGTFQISFNKPSIQPFSTTEGRATDFEGDVEEPQADTSITTSDSEIENIVKSVALGDGSNYSATAGSQTSVAGEFQLEAGEFFSFNFEATLDLRTVIDNPSEEFAAAFGDIGFELIDSRDQETPIAFFAVTGNLLGFRDGEFLTYNSTNSIDLGPIVLLTNFTDNEEFAQASIKGTFQTTFDMPTRLFFRETKQAATLIQAEGAVQDVPEPTTVLGLLFLAGAGISLKKKSLGHNF